MIQNKDKKATRFFSDRLKEEFNSEKYFPSAPNKVPENSRQVDESVFSDISLLAIFDLIRLKRGKLTEDQISSYLYTFPELSDKLELRKKLSQLKSAGLIQYRSTRGKCTDFKAISKRLFFQIDAKTAHHMTQYSENLKRALQRPEVKIWLGSGFVSISKEDFPEFRERYFEFRNWVLALDDRAGQSAGPTMLFQFDMNVFNLVHCPETINCKLSAW
ncbi:MAG: hypothetical protein IT288_08120 [Bdellovibrionales bacterium]|nr:hypothetical protein [Bdellovibrionales bacterium]